MRGSTAETNAEADRDNPELEHRRCRNEADAGVSARPPETPPWDEREESDPPAGSRLLLPAVTVVRARPNGASAAPPNRSFAWSGGRSRGRDMRSALVEAQPGVLVAG
jgi:hypothetical protein